MTSMPAHLLGGGIGHSVYEPVELITHVLRRNAGSGAFEVLFTANLEEMKCRSELAHTDDEEIESEWSLLYTRISDLNISYHGGHASCARRLLGEM